MSLLTAATSLALWHKVVKNAENSCSVTLEEGVEAYLISLLSRYIDKPEVVKKIFATAFLEAVRLGEKQRKLSLQNVGDGCLLFAGLFPQSAEKRQVKVSYYVDLGRSAYAGISDKSDDLYASLALQFVVLMDVLQSIQNTDLLPIEAYNQWNEVGSLRALKILQTYSNALPLRTKG